MNTSTIELKTTVGVFFTLDEFNSHIDAAKQAGILEERKRLSKIPPAAWTGKGCGVISDKGKQITMEGEHHGGEFAIAAQAARAHDIALIPRPTFVES
jgi:hypothetical protein